MPSKIAINHLLLAVFLPSIAIHSAQPVKTKPRPPASPPIRFFTKRNVPYVTNGHERQKLDLYLPTKGDSLPVLVWVHGGGWEKGDKGRPPGLDGFIARGFAVAAINYRYSTQAPFPAQIEDCKSAVRWLRAHASEHRLDPNRVGAYGISAGGQLVALLGTSGAIKQFDKGENLQFSSRVQAVCDSCGSTDFLRYTTSPDSKGVLRHLFGGPIMQKLDLAKLASPVYQVTRDAPPFIFFHGARDTVVPLQQSQLLHAALKKAGCDSTLVVDPRAGHSFFQPQAALEFFDRVLIKRASSARGSK